MRNDLDDRHPLLKEIEALEERNRASMREINRVLDAATSSHGTWAVQWPEELRGDEEGWSRDGGSRQFATGFIQYLLDDEEVAAAATFIRHSWGNASGIVTKDQVARQR